MQMRVDSHHRTAAHWMRMWVRVDSRRYHHTVTQEEHETRLTTLDWMRVKCRHSRYHSEELYQLLIVAAIEVIGNLRHAEVGQQQIENLNQ